MLAVKRRFHSNIPGEELNRATKRPLRKLLIVAALWLLLWPMQLWNHRVANIPRPTCFRLYPDRLVANSSGLIDAQRWLSGHSFRTTPTKLATSIFDLRTGKRKDVTTQPLEIYQNNQRFTFEDVPFTNGYSVRIEDPNGQRPPRERLVNIFGSPLLVNGRYLVWSRKRSFEVVDLDQEKLSVMDSDNPRFVSENSLMAVPGFDRFYCIKRPLGAFRIPNDNTLELFKIEQGKVVPVANWSISNKGMRVSLATRCSHLKNRASSKSIRSKMDA